MASKHYQLSKQASYWIQDYIGEVVGFYEPTCFSGSCMAVAVQDVDKAIETLEHWTCQVEEDLSNLTDIFEGYELTDEDFEALLVLRDEGSKDVAKNSQGKIFDLLFNTSIDVA